MEEKEKRNASAKKDQDKTAEGKKGRREVRLEETRRDLVKTKKGGHLLNVISLHYDSVFPKAMKDINWPFVDGVFFVQDAEAA